MYAEVMDRQSYRRPRIRPSPSVMPEPPLLRTRSADEIELKLRLSREYEPIRRRSALSRGISQMRSASRSFIFALGPNGLARRRSINRHSLAEEVPSDCPLAWLPLGTDDLALDPSSVSSSRTNSIRSPAVSDVLLDVFPGSSWFPGSPVPLQQVHILSDSVVGFSDQIYAARAQLRVRN